MSLIGPPLRETPRRVGGLDDDLAIEALAQAFRRAYDERGFRLSVPHPGMDDALHRLHARGVMLHIVTNKRILPTRRILAHLSWEALFADVMSLDGVTPAAANKAELIARFLAERNIDADDATIVGDTPEDSIAAALNGIAFATASWGYGRFDEPCGARVLQAPAEIADLTK